MADPASAPGPGAGLREEVGRGIAYMLAAVALFSVMAALVKAMGAHYPVGQVMFFRNACALPAALLILAGTGGLAALRTRRFPSHLLRATTGVGAMGSGFFALTVMPLADATALSFTHALFVTLLAIPMLGERVGPHRGGAVLAGFVGVLVLAAGQGGFSGGAGTAGIAAALANALLSAISMLLVRQMSASESSAAIAAWQALISTALTALLLPFGWITPPWRDLPYLVAIGLSGGIAQYWVTQAYRFGPASVMGAYSYTSMLWAVLFGWLVWGDVPGPVVLLGSAIVVASGLYILHRELVWARRRREGAGR